jgi:ABC-type spermidine/putrescine transport system permease subunit II
MSPLETMPVSPFARQTRWLLKGLAAIILVFLYLPIGFLILFSFEEASTPGLPITGLTLSWYQKMLSDSAIQTAVLNSVIVAAAVAVLATVIGTMAAFPLVRGGIPRPGAARLLFTMPIMIPGVLLGIGLLIFFRRVADLNLSLVTVIAGHLVFTTPFVVLIVAARLQGFDRRLEWAAADLGADSRATLRHIVLPLISPAIIAGALLSVTLSIDEFVITYFTIGPQLTLPLYIYTQIKFGVTPEVNAVATVILVVTLGVFGLGSLVLSRGRRLLRPHRGSTEGRA